jgi:tetratricopeptide (TPR) repeat protein
MMTPRTLLLISFVIGCIGAAVAQKREHPSADQIVQKAIEALGGYEKIKAIQSLNYSGLYKEGTYAGAAHMTRMRPNRRLVGCVPHACDGKQGDYLEIFDGQRGWEVNLKRQRLIQMRRKAELAGRCGAEFDPMFVDYKQKGYQLRFAGTETVGDRPAWVVRITPSDCQERLFYFDQQTYMPLADRMLYNVHARGQAVDQLHIMTDYREVNGVKMPFHGEERNYKTGELISAGEWEKIEANTVKDESIFVPPAVHPGRGTKLVLEMLEASETKPASGVLAMYREFRGHPENKTVDMESDLTFLGYELLKADRYDSAIPVMQWLVEQYPNANAFDSLGDAYAQKGDKAQAIAAYRRAVELDPKALDTRIKLEKLEK